MAFFSPTSRTDRAGNAPQVACDFPVALVHRGWRIDVLGDQLFSDFTQKLDMLGYVSGKNISIIREIAPPKAKAVEVAVTKLLPEIDNRSTRACPWIAHAGSVSV